MKTFDSGARSSEEAPRIDLIPLASLTRQAARMAEGAASHGERNYEKGANDPTFIRDRKNHLVLHALSYLAGATDDDHLGAILANAGMLARLEELAAFVTNEQPEPVNADVHVVATVHGIANMATVTNTAKIYMPNQAARTYDETRAEASKCEFCDRPNLTNPKACAGGCVFARWPVSGTP